MTKFEVDLETERVQFDGAWLSSEELSGRITQAIAQKNFGGVGRLGEALEQLAQAVAGAKSVTLKLSSDAYAKLEAAGTKLGKPAHVFARDLLMQVLAGAPAPAPQAAPPVAQVIPAPVAPPVIAAPPVVPPPVVAPAPVASSEVAPEEAAAALTLTPKRRENAPPPPVMTPVAPPAPAGPQPSVVVDLAGEEKPKAGGPNDNRRWFNRS